MTDSPPRPGARFARFFVAVALIGAIGNLAAEAAVPTHSEGIRRQGADLGGFLSGEQSHVAERYQLYGQLHDLAAGGSIVLPRNVLGAYELTYLSDLTVTRTTRPGWAREAVIDDVMPFEIHRGLAEIRVGAEEVPYVIATKEPFPSHLIVLVTRRSGTMLIVDEALAEAIGAR